MEDEAKVETVKIRPMAIVPGTNPFEAFLLFACIALGGLHLLGLSPQNSISGLLPNWALSLWYANLGIGSAVALYGGLRARRVAPGKDESTLRSGLVQFAIGWLYVGSASITYGVLILLLFPDTGTVTGLTTTAWGIASHVRAYQVRRLLRMRGGGQHRNV